jgi:hypothetical protein
MASHPLPVDPTDVGCYDGSDCPTRTVSVSLDRLQHLMACEARADLQKRHMELLQKQITDADAALKLELARGEKHAEALTHIARTCDERTSEMKEQHAATTAKVEAENAALKARLVELEARIAKREAAIEEKDAIIKAKDAVIQEKDAAASGYATAASDLRTSVATLTTQLQAQQYEVVSELGGGSRLYVIPLGTNPPPAPPPPPPLRFDAEWYARSVTGTNFQCDLNAPHYDRVRCIAHEDPHEDPVDADAITSRVVVRTAAPLPRPPRRIDAAPTREVTPATCTFVIVKYAPKDDGVWDCTPKDDGGVWHCAIGLLPSTAAARPTRSLGHLGGCTVYPHPNGAHPPGGWWTPFANSEFANSMKVPQGGAVRFTVDYAASTCRLACYTPAAVANDFAQPPYATTELFFNTPIPDDVTLYPAVNVMHEGFEVRLL